MSRAFADAPFQHVLDRDAFRPGRRWPALLGVIAALLLTVGLNGPGDLLGWGIEMSKTRRTISLIVAILLTVSGIAGAVWFLFFAPIYSFRLASGAGLVLAVGVMWLYSDFIDATPRT